MQEALLAKAFQRERLINIRNFLVNYEFAFYVALLTPKRQICLPLDTQIEYFNPLLDKKLAHL